MLNVTDGMIESGDVVQNFHLMNELRGCEVGWCCCSALPGLLGVVWAFFFVDDCGGGARRAPPFTGPGS